MDGSLWRRQLNHSHRPHSGLWVQAAWSVALQWPRHWCVPQPGTCQMGDGELGDVGEAKAPGHDHPLGEA